MTLIEDIEDTRAHITRTEALVIKYPDRPSLGLALMSLRRRLRVLEAERDAAFADERAQQ